MVKQNKKLVIITGGTSGIGSAIAKLFLSKQWKVVITARHKKGLANLKNNNIKFCKMDVTVEEDHKRIINESLKWNKTLDCYINCAGISSWMPIEKVDNNFFYKLIDTNLKSIIWGCKSSFKKMKSGGSIINISSIASKRGSKNNSIYCASKFAVNGVTQSLAKEFGKKNIRVNAVCPVNILTGGLKKAFKSKYSPIDNKNIDQYLKDFILNHSALKKLPNEKDVAELCYFLASNNSKYLTGQCINIDAGVLPQ